LIRHDRVGRTYSTTRQPDPRIGAVIEQGLRGMATVANIGTGTGSYQPSNAVVTVEPSKIMIRQHSDVAAQGLRATSAECHYVHAATVVS
jgi:hypothetical protein